MINKVFNENVKNVYDDLIKKMSNYFSLKNHNHKLVNLTDVNLTGATQGNYISYDNGIWVPTSGSSTDLSNFYTKQQTDNNFLSGNTTISDLYGYTTGQTDILLSGKTNLSIFNSHTGQTNPHRLSFTGLTYTGHTHLFSDIIGSSPSSSFIYASVWVDSNQTSDSNGARGDINKPFKTPEAARDAALSGDTIFVMPGTYTITTTNTNGLSKEGVTWYLNYGAIFNKSTTGHMFAQSWSWLGTSNVLGYGTFNVTSNAYYIFASQNLYKSTYEAYSCSSSGVYGCFAVYQPDSEIIYNIKYATSTTGRVLDMFQSITGNPTKITINCHTWKSTASSVIGGGWWSAILNINGIKLESSVAVTIDYFHNYSSILLNVSEIIGVNYGIRCADASNAKFTINCAKCTGVYVLGAYGILSGFFYKLYNGGGNIEGGDVAYIECAGGYTKTTSWNNGVVYLGKSYVSVSGGILDLIVLKSSYSSDFSFTGGIVNINSWEYMRTGYGSFIIGGAQVYVNCMMRFHESADYPQTVCIVLNSGKLFLNNFIKNMLATTGIEHMYGGITWNGGDIIVNNGGIVLTSLTALPIRTTISNKQLKVQGTYSSNRVCNNINGQLSKWKITISGIAVTNISFEIYSPNYSTVSITESDTTTYNTKAKIAQRMTELINTGSYLISASQDSVGVDEYLYVYGDDYINDVRRNLSNTNIVVLELQYNSFPFTEICGGVINENIYIE